MKSYWITTIDNPFDPFTQFDDWYRFDVDKGYNTCSYVARIAMTSNELSDEEQKAEINRAVLEIARLNLLGIYKVVEEDDENEENLEYESPESSSEDS